MNSVAARNFKNWRRTFAYYLDRHLEGKENAQQAKLNALISFVSSRGVRSRNFVGPNPTLIRNHYSCILIQALLCYKK